MYAQVEKSKENKSRSVANSVSEKKSAVSQCIGIVDNRAKTSAQKNLQDIINSSENDSTQLRNKIDKGNDSSDGPLYQSLSQNNSAPVQRYRIGFGSSKISENEKLVWKDSLTTYAGDDQFIQANSIADGQIEFTKGSAHPSIGELNLVKAQAKENSDLEKGTSSFDQGAEEKWVSKAALRGFAEKINKDLTELYADQIAKLESEDEWDRLDNLESKLTEIAEKAAPAEFKKSEIATKVHQYLIANKVLALQKRALMPSDCRAMASYVAGFDAGSEGEETDEIAVGNVYEYTAKNRDVSEWDFHYATIVMTDGNDHITMENAAAKASDKFSKMQYDRTWFFEMYGPDQGQTFADKYAEEMGDA